MQDIKTNSATLDSQPSLSDLNAPQVLEKHDDGSKLSVEESSPNPRVPTSDTQEKFREVQSFASPSVRDVRTSDQDNILVNREITELKAPKSSAGKMSRTTGASSAVEADLTVDSDYKEFLSMLDSYEKLPENNRVEVDKALESLKGLEEKAQALKKKFPSKTLPIDELLKHIQEERATLEKGKTLIPSQSLVEQVDELHNAPARRRKKLTRAF